MWWVAYVLILDWVIMSGHTGINIYVKYSQAIITIVLILVKTGGNLVECRDTQLETGTISDKRDVWSL